jgi:hydrogenase maturation protease
VADRAVLLIGLGNELRGDDGVGLEVARRLGERAARAGIEVREHQGEPTQLLEAWQGADSVVLVDTMRSGVPPGTIRRCDASREPLPAPVSASSSTHAFAVGEAIELARALHRLPERVIVFAVEGRSFATGAPLSAELMQAAEALADAVLGEALALARA